MKKFVSSFLALAALIFVSSGVSAQPAKKAQWKEMLDFHEVMSETFHSAEAGNLAPLKEKSSLLIERAKTWKASAVPAGYKPEETAKVLKRLVKQCKAVHKAVKKGKPDAVLTASITTAHDIFHEIMEKCRE
jgi:hypothetical protein